MKKDLLMILGPVQMRKEVLEAGALQIKYPRTEEHSIFFKQLSKKLQNLFCTKEPVLCVTGSGTAAMQMAVFNSIIKGDKVQTFNTGTFGKRWSDIILDAGFECDIKDIEFGRNITAAEVSEIMRKDSKPDVIFVTYNETSSASICDLKSIASITKDTDTILVVDAVSSLGAEELKMDEWGCDVVITGSQKFIGIAPGLSFIAFSKKAQLKIQKIKCNSYYFDAKKYLKEFNRGQVPFTAPLSLLNQLDIQLTYFENYGMDKLRVEYRERTEYLRSKLYSIGFTPFSKNMGNCTTSVVVPDGVNAEKFSNDLRLKYGVAIGCPYPGSNVVRIGNFGDISKEDIDYCVSSIKDLLGL